MTYSRTDKKIWNEQSARWQHVGLPTRPTVEDGKLMLELAGYDTTREDRVLEIAVLGVTPEVVQLNWSQPARLRAYDMSTEMISAVWRPHPKIPSDVYQARWQSLPLNGKSVDLVVGDGCLTALPDKSDCRAVFSEISRVLKTEGRLVMRCFVRPENPETIDQIVVDVNRRRVRYFGTLKWRLAMAMCAAESSGVRPEDIYTTFNSLFTDRVKLAELTGWHTQTINTIDSYKDMHSRFTFLTMPELESVCVPWLGVKAISYGHYELSERCPTVLFGLL